MSKPFHFKQFTVEQDQCTMKIGTDGVLLGAWANLDTNPSSILDIGAGTGVIALMMAQRSNADLIDALEIDENAYEQCVDNFENSFWGDRLFCYHASLDEFSEEMEGEQQYDLIISNPPFFEENHLSPKSKRNLARFTNALPFEDLLHYTAPLLSENGNFCTIIPYKSQEKFIEMALVKGLYLQKLTKVQGNVNSAIKRSLLQFGFQKKEIETSHLIIEIERHVYTQDYKNLVEDFYLPL